MKQLLISLLISLGINFNVAAEPFSSVATGVNQAESQVSQPSISDNINAMDQDKDGIITSEEISQYLQAQRGRGYRQSFLDELAKVTNSRSCGSPFSRSVY